MAIRQKQAEVLGVVLSRTRATAQETLADAARVIGCSDASLQQWETGLMAPHPHQMPGIARYLRVTLDEALVLRAATIERRRKERRSRMRVAPCR